MLVTSGFQLALSMEAWWGWLDLKTGSSLPWRAELNPTSCCHYFSSEFHLISQHEINIALKKVFVSLLLNGKFQNSPVTFPPIMQEEAFSPKTRVDSVPAPGRLSGSFTINTPTHLAPLQTRNKLAPLPRRAVLCVSQFCLFALDFGPQGIWVEF